MSCSDRETVQHCVVIFPSMSGVLRAEKLLKAEGIPLKLVPVPRHLSSDCGVCLRFGRHDEARVREVMAEKCLQPYTISPI